jgi:fibronectin type 3 domain-containing protein/nitrous oxidase accessory protein NosD
VGEKLANDPITWGGDYKDEIKYGSSAYGYITTGFLGSLYSNKLSVSTLYDRDYPGNNWLTSDIINVINENVNLINHMGHASSLSLMKMGNSEIDNFLINDELYCIGYSQGCYAGAFDDRNAYNGPYLPYDCIVEHLTTEAHGSVAFVANSRYGWYAPGSTAGASQYFDRAFWNAILGNNILNIGVANQYSKEENAGRITLSNLGRWCAYELNLLGDPELKVRFPSEAHQLEVDLESPIYLTLGSSLILNTTVYNRGLSDETSVELRLNIDGATAYSETIPFLAAGSNYTMSYTWNPANEAVFNITVQTPPVQGEYLTDDNIKTIHVLVNAKSILIVNDDDGTGFVSGTSLSAFTVSLTSLGHSYLVWNESSMANPPLNILTNFKLVIWTCGDYWNRAVDPLDALALRSYVASGGKLLLEGEDIGYDHSADDFMLKVAHAVYQIDKTNAPGLTVENSDHPVTEGLTSGFLWSLTPPYDDGVVPANTGESLLHYTGTDWTAVTAFEDSNSKTVYFAFPLYCLSSTEQQKLSINSINWLLSPSAELTWGEKTTVCEETLSTSEYNPSIAANTNGWLYAAYEHFNNTTGLSEVFLSESKDEGLTWNRIYFLSWSNNLRRPSIAIDVGDNNNIFVVFEREWTANDHDIFVLRRVNSLWSVSPIANTLGSDDRYPSITCEFQYGSLNRLYVSYEYVYNNDDRDVMFSKSLDDGSSWTTQQLHGGWPDGNVHCQTSITTTRGSNGNDIIYIVYKWGADYNTAYDIVMDKSQDRGISWTQQWICDETSRDKNSPTIAATRGGGTVIVAWHVFWSDYYLNDIQYAYSTDNGVLWSPGWIALDYGGNEQSPVLTVDGKDSSSVYTYGKIHLTFWEDGTMYYRQADFSYPWLWTAKEPVCDISLTYTKPTITTFRNPTGRYLPAIAFTSSNASNNEVCYITRNSESPRTILVPDHFSTIQKAINAAYPGDSIHVSPGTYGENVVVNKTVSLLGAGAEDTIIDGGLNGNVLTITAPNVSVSGFTIRRSGGNAHGVYLDSCNNSITNNIITGNTYGVAGFFSNCNSVRGNSITENIGYGVSFSSMSDYNNISENDIAANGAGVSFGNGAGYNSISRNNITMSSDDGIIFSNSGDHNTVSGNSITSNGGNGITIFAGGIFSFVSGNNITGNNYGVELSDTVGNNISANIVANNYYGIWFGPQTAENVVVSNNITYNLHSVYMSGGYYGSADNVFYHNNFVGNIYSVSPPSGYSNTWDNGYPSGGNYWSDYTGVDANHDGIGDTPYVIDANNEDNYPLMNEWSPHPTQAAFDFGTSVSPVHAGYIRVTESTSYSAASGYGWSSTAGLDSRDRSGPDDLRCDFVFSSAEHTFNVDLSNGVYIVAVVIGDQNFIHDRIDVYAEGALTINDLTASTGSFQEVSFRVTVADGQLNLGFLDDGGVDSNWVLSGLTVQVASPLPTEASFDFGTAESSVGAGYARVSPSTSYSAALGYGWSNTAGLDCRDRGSPDDLRCDFVFSSAEHTFNVDLANGDYLITIMIGDQSFMHDQINVYAEGTLVINRASVAGGSFQEISFRVTVIDEQLNLRIVDDGGADSNWVLDALTIVVAPSLPTEASFDFGTSGSPVQAGYTQVTEYTAYSAGSGYGWSSTTGLGSRDRGAPDDLRSDLVFGAAEHTFNVDLAKGDYAVTVVVGDQSFMHDMIDVYAEGVLKVNGLTAPAGSFQEVSFNVSVNDGQLNLRILDSGGTDVNWVLNVLTVVNV